MYIEEIATYGACETRRESGISIAQMRERVLGVVWMVGVGADDTQGGRHRQKRGRWFSSIITVINDKEKTCATYQHTLG
jgi:hypothetical protein